MVYVLICLCLVVSLLITLSQQYYCFCQFDSLCLIRSLSIGLSDCLCLSFSVSLCLILFDSLSQCFSLNLYVSVSICLFVFLPQSVCLSVSICVVTLPQISLYLSLCLILSDSLCAKSFFCLSVPHLSACLSLRIYKYITLFTYFL